MEAFSKLVEQVAYRHDMSTVFDDFLTMALCAFSYGQQEELYLKTIKRYDKNELQLMAATLAAMIAEYDQRSQEGKWCDVLGEFFEEHNGKFGRSARGQFFTPPSVCDIMAQLTADGKPLEDRKINDPCVGSGRTLIALDRTNAQNRLHNFYLGQDVDQRCSKMFALNMKMYGMKGVSIHMNSITNEIFSGYRIYLPEMGGQIRFMRADECAQYVFTEQKKEETTTIEAPKQEQLQLFKADW